MSTDLHIGRGEREPARLVDVMIRWALYGFCLAFWVAVWHAFIH